MDNNYVESITKRYVYDVVRRLPQNQRLDIEKELHTLIEDMLCERIGDNPPTNKDIDIVLMELGDPMDLANKYRDEKRCLISGEYYESYIFVLKIVLTCVTLGIIIASFVSSYINFANEINNAASVWQEIAKKIASLISNGLINLFSAWTIAFAWVTIIFAVIEKGKYRVMFYGGYVAGEWAPNNLPQIPNESVVIKKTESIVGIVFDILIIILFVFAPKIMGVWTYNGIIPLFNMEIWGSILPLFVGCCVIGLIRNIIKLVIGKYDNTVMVTTIITNILSLALTIILFSCFAVWNPNFATDLQQAYSISFTGEYEIFSIITSSVAQNIFVVILAFAFVLDTGTVIFKTLKANRMLA